MQGGDAADEFVRIMLNGTEVAIRLTGSAAKNLAALLIAWSKNEKKVFGKTSMMKLLKSGEQLHVLTNMPVEQYKEFRRLAGKKVLYAPFVNKRKGDSKLDVVLSEKSLPLINHILKRIGYGSVEQAQEQRQEPELKKKDIPSKQSSKDAKARSEVSKDGQNPKREEKQSVREKLENNRKQLERQPQRQAPARNKSKSKGR